MSVNDEKQYKHLSDVQISFFKDVSPARWEPPGGCSPAELSSIFVSNQVVFFSGENFESFLARVIAWRILLTQKMRLIRKGSVVRSTKGISER